MARPSSFRAKLKSALLNVLLALLSCFAALLVGEICLRLFAPQNIVPRYVETAPYGIRKNVANVRGEMLTDEYRHTFNTNSQGFRGLKEYSVEKRPDTYRVVVLGDSVALGYGVGDDETFSALLERELSRTRPAEVINMGVSGFGTAEELILLRNVGLKYDPDLVILAYFPNDPYNNAVSGLFRLVEGKLAESQESTEPAIYIRDRLNKIPGYSFFCQHSHLVNFVRGLFSRYFIRKLARKHNIESTVPRKLDRQQKALTAALVSRMALELEERGVSLIILDIPLVLGDEVFSNLPADSIRLGRGAHLVDVQTQIHAGHAVDKLSYEKDCHPTPLGHRLIAEWLAKFIAGRPWNL